MRLATLIAAVALALNASAPAAEPTVFLVRHAEKADATRGDPKDPELSDAGRARAESLAVMLKDVKLTAIYVTEFKRTQQTAEAIARTSNVKQTIVAAKDTGSLVARLKQATGNVLVVGHSNTIPDIIKSLGAADAITIADDDYDNLFVCTPGTPPQLLRLHYR